MLKLYQREDCPFSQTVRARLTALGLSYVCMNVPRSVQERGELELLTGQSKIPILVDGDEVLTDTRHILAYLDRRYGAPTDADTSAAPALRKSFTDRPSYGMTRELHGLSFHAAREKIEGMLARVGFSIVAVTDLAVFLKSRLDVDLGRPYLILHTSHPRLAHEALVGEPYVGSLLLSNVLITETDGGHAVISAARPIVVLESVTDPSVREIAERAEALLLKAITSL